LAHGLINTHDSITVVGLLLLLKDSKTNGDEKVDPTPKGKIPSKSEQPHILGNSAEPLVRKVGRVEGKENSV
jgi:hypothetical protein